MLARKDFLLINLHVPYEREVAGTDLLIPFDEVERRRDLLPRNRSAKILLYCRSGAMSDTAARTVVRRGLPQCVASRGRNERMETGGTLPDLQGPEMRAETGVREQSRASSRPGLPVAALEQGETEAAKPARATDRAW